MYLIPTGIYSTIRHTGGNSIKRNLPKNITDNDWRNDVINGGN